jgi:type II secretory pathway component PulC
MNKLNYFLKNINLLNIILIAAIFISAAYMILPLYSTDMKYTLPSVKKPVSEAKEKPAESTIPSLSDYTIIAEDNLFHPDRKIPPVKTAEQELPKPEFVLYGTMITDDNRLAYLSDRKAPLTTPGRGERQSVLHEGNTLSGYTLREILPDKVIMVRGEDKIEVDVVDSSKKRSQVATQPTPTQQPVAKQRAQASSAEKSKQKELREELKNLRQQRRESQGTQGRTLRGNRLRNVPPSPPNTSSLSSTSITGHGD